MKLLTKTLLTIFALFFLFGCASQQTAKIPSFDAKEFNADEYTSKIDNFIILFDASSSMDKNDGPFKKFDMAKKLAYVMNTSIPELDQTAGLRSFGHAPELTNENTVLFYEMGEYSTENLEKSFDKITKAGGLTPLYLALDATVNDFEGLSGDRNAVIIISDGMDLEDNVLTSAKKLKTLYGDSTCFYPILIGNDENGNTIFKKLADIGGCGFVSTYDGLMSDAGMAQFVENVFIDEKPDVALENVLFDSGKSVIKTEYFALLDNVVEILEKNSDMRFEINGHCDNRGTDKYNSALSIRRANAVKDYLVEKGISEDRLTIQGFSFTRPAALNDTTSGRAANRRVELNLY